MDSFVVNVYLALACFNIANVAGYARLIGYYILRLSFHSAENNSWLS